MAYTKPTFKVLVDFTSAPTSMTNRYWQDISAYVSAFDGKRGRSFELDSIQAGTLNLTVDNTSGAFDPTNTSSPYYPNVKPLKRVKVATGYKWQVIGSRPFAYYRLGGSGVDTATVTDTMAYRDGVIAGGTITTGACLTAQATGAVSQASTGNGFVRITPVATGATDPFHLAAATGFTAECWINATSLAASASVINKFTAFGANNEYNLSINTNGSIQLLAYNTGGTAYHTATSAAGVIATGTTYHVAFTYETSAHTTRVYVNGSQVASATGASGTLQTVGNEPVDIGGDYFASTTSPLKGRFQEAAFYSRALSATELLAHYTAGANEQYEAELFTGYVENWPIDWSSHYESTVTVPCSDAFYLFNGITLPSGYDIDVMLNSPKAYYKFDEQLGTTCFDATTNARDGVYTQAVSATGNVVSTTGIAQDGGMSISITGSDYNGHNIGKLGPGVNLPSSVRMGNPCSGFGPWVANRAVTGFTVEGWIQTADSPEVSGVSVTPVNIIYAQGPTDYTSSVGQNDQLILGIDTNGHPVMFLGGPGGISATGVDVRSSFYSTHLAMTIDNVNNASNAPPLIKLYVNGSQVTATGSYSALLQPINGGAAFAKLYTDVVTYDPAYSAQPQGFPRYGYFTGRLDNWAIYDTALSSSDISARYFANAFKWVGQSPTTRLTKLLTFISWDLTYGIDLDTGKTTLGDWDDIKDATVLATFQDIERNESGLLYIAKDGRVTFRDRHAEFTRTASKTSQATLGDGSSELPYTSIEFDYSSTNVYNAVKVADTYGGYVVREDITSQATYLKRTLNSEVRASSQDEATRAAEWLLKAYKDPVNRIKAVTVEPQSNVSQWQNALGRELLDKVTVKRRPPTGSTISTDCLIQGMSFRYSASDQSFSTTFNLSPAPANDVMILDDATYGILDTDRMAW